MHALRILWLIKAIKDALTAENIVRIVMLAKETLTIVMKYANKIKKVQIIIKFLESIIKKPTKENIAKQIIIILNAFICTNDKKQKQYS